VIADQPTTQPKLNCSLLPPNSRNLKKWTLFYISETTLLMTLFYFWAKHAYSAWHLSNPSRVIITISSVLLLLNVASILVNKLMLHSLMQGSGKVWITHRMSLDTAKEKIAAGVLTPYTTARNIETQWFVNLVDGKKPCTWVSVGKPGEVSDFLLGNIRSNKWTVAVCCQVSADCLIPPPNFFKHYLGIFQHRLLGVVDLSAGCELYVRKSKDWEWIERSDFENLRST